MKKILLTLSILLMLLLTSCIFPIVILDGKWETSENFKVEPGTSPTELINKYLDTSDSSKNYFITFYNIGCPYCYRQMGYCNKLYEETKNDFEWIACTIWDTLEENKIRNKLNYPDSINYKYPIYTNINGLRSSLRNLYYNNDIPEGSCDPMNIIIVNDTIVEIIRGSIASKERYNLYNNRLDSLSEH